MIKYHCGVLAAACAAVFSSFAGTSADIQVLIDAADPGATVTIPSGTYLLETPVLVDKAITLTGDSADRTLVILDGQDKVNCVELSEGATLRDLTVQNGAGGKTVGSTLCGAGVYAIGATIDNCIIRGCALNNEDTKFMTDGAGLYLNGGTVRGCLFSGNVNTGCGSSAGNVYTGHKIRGGGVYAKGTATFSNCRFVSNRVVNNNKGRADNGVGGAGCFDGAGIVVENCSFEDNFATCWGGALCGQGITLRNSTFTGNSHASPNYVRGGAAAVEDARVSGCVFEGQEMTTGADGSGECLSTFGASVVTDCIFRNNSYNRGGAFGSSSGSPVVSNCVFEANTCTDRGGALSLVGVTSAQIVDCWVVDTTCGSYGSAIYLMNGAKAVTVRNCWFLRNSKADGYAISLYFSADNAVTIENCSFVKNACGGVVYDASRNAIANIKVKNVLAYGNDYTSTKPFGAHADFATNGNIAFVASDDMTNLDLSDASGNVDLGETKPKNIFRDLYSDPANYALAPVSPAKDAGTAEVPDWVGDGTLDMGTGEYEVTAVADYGVKIARVGAKPRVVNGRIDIGAAEYEYEQGDDDWGKEPTEPYTPGEALLVFENGSEKIAETIAVTAPGELVAVPKGIYRMSGALTPSDIIGLRSLANHPGAVVLDFQGQSAGLYSAEAIEVRGVTISNAVGGVEVSAGRWRGAGICLTAEESLITNCVVRACSIETSAAGTDIYGAGIYTKGALVNTQVSGCTLYRHPASADNRSCCGAGVFLEGGLMSGCDVFCCTNRGSQAGGVAQNVVAVAGGGVYASDRSLVENCTFTGNVVDNMKEGGSGRTDVGQGGGIFLDGTATVMRNCQVVGNTAPAGAAGVLLDSGRVENCTIKDNYLASAVVSISHPYAAGIIVKGGTVTGCSITGNKSNADGTGGSRTYGVAVEFLGENSKLLNSLIAENKTKDGGIIQFSASNCLVSNCVVRANQASNQGAPFGTESPETVNHSLVTDCWIEDNVGGSYGAVAFVKGVGSGNAAKGDGLAILFRNCLIAGNGVSSGNMAVYIYFTKNAGVSVENCTFVNNKVSALFGLSSATESAGTCEVLNTVAYGNGTGQTVPTAIVEAGNVTHSAFDVKTGMNFDETTGNIDLSATDPQFADPANGVYALKRNSPLRDKGVAGDWAKVEGCTDLGDGTYTIAAALDWGVTVTGNNRHPRTGVKKAVGVIDIGACEYYQAPGLMLILR